LQRKEQEPEVKRYKQDNENLMSRMRELKKKQTGLLSEIDNLKASRVDWTDKIVCVLFVIYIYIYFFENKIVIYMNLGYNYLNNRIIHNSCT
jgi:hypothetical protein